jgi:hypothetical protein
MNSQSGYLFGLLTLLCSQVISQPAVAVPAPVDVERAGEAYAAKNWPTAATAYAALATAEPQNATYQARWGVALIGVGQAPAGLRHLKTAEDLGLPAANAAFREACAYAQMNDTAHAFAELERANQAGLAQVAALDSDEFLANLRSDPRWPVIRAAAEANAHPCDHDARYRQLDFWLGEWDVRANGTSTGPLVGSSQITKIHDGCVIFESWQGTSGLTGNSFNIYDASRDKWYQTWVDSSGGLHEYSGSTEGGSMVYFADLAPAPGQTGRVHTRLTFTHLSDDRVRQHSEQTLDGGKTWSDNYDLVYSRRKAK